MPYLIDKGRDDIEFGIKAGFDFIAASFTRCAQDIMQIRELLQKHNCDSIKIIAKIENAQGVNNIDEILRVSDGIMIARGDMGVEIPLEEVPSIQKKLIRKAFDELLEKQGVEAFGEVGDPFDPQLHAAVAHTDDESAGENCIAEVFQKGYRMGDRVLRYAMVKVAN